MILKFTIKFDDQKKKRNNKRNEYLHVLSSIKFN
jgi:hypothetical protein